MNRENLINSVQNRLAESGYSSSNQLNHPQLCQEEYDDLARYAQKGDVTCRNLLIICLGRFVHSAASNYIVNRNDADWTYDDLMQSGFLGINYALDHWKEELGIFTSFSMYYIRKEINHQIHILGNMIVIEDPHRANLAFRLNYLREMCESDLGSEVSDAVLADWINEKGHAKNLNKRKMDSNDIFSMTNSRVSISLDSEILDGDSSTTLLEVLIDQNSLSPVEELINAELEEGKKLLARRLLGTLTDKQKNVVELYYGFDIEATCIESGKVTFESVARVLQERQKENWNKYQCQLLHTRALERMKKFIKSFSNLGYNYA